MKAVYHYPLLKAICFSSVMLYFAMVIAQPNPRDDLAKAGLRGPVHIVTELSEYGDQTDTYNQRGLLINTLFVYDDARYRTLRNYDEQGRLVEALYYKNGILTSSFVLEYSEGQWLRTTDYKEGKVTAYSVRAENLSDLPQPRDYGLTIFWFDEQGNVGSQFSLFPSDSRPLEEIFAERPHYTYDEAGRKLEQFSLDPDGKKQMVYGYRYNEQGLLEEETEFDRVSEDGRYDTKTLYTYDASGNVLTESEYNNEGDLRVVIKYEYEFDDYGNWIKKDTYRKHLVYGQPESEFVLDSSQMREITYY